VKSNVQFLRFRFPTVFQVRAYELIQQPISYHLTRHLVRYKNELVFLYHEKSSNAYCHIEKSISYHCMVILVTSTVIVL
jgi:hypothetical protein